MPYDLQDMLVRTRDLKIPYFGHDIRISYYVEKLTKSFRADVVRFMRLSQELEKERTELVERLQAEREAREPGDLLAVNTELASETETERLLAKLDDEDTRLKRKIDEALADILADWDLTNKGEPYPLNADNLGPVDARLEGAIVNAIMNDSTPLGEASGQQSTKLLPYTLKPKAKPGQTRHRHHG